VPETLLARVKAGQTINAVAAAWPDQPFTGTIDSVDPVLNADTRAATVRAILPNGDRRLKPGMLLTVTIEAAARESPAVPELAIVGEGEQSFVFVVEKDAARRVPVRTGIRQNGMVEILSGIQPGQRVITEGVVKVTDGQKIRLASQGNSQPKGN
jgi:membrane fusion protein, multidrug efflux system